MSFCEKEGNDKGFLCCCGSYVGVIVAGVIQAIALVYSVIFLFSVEGLYFGLFFSIITLIGTISFIVNLIQRESVQARMCLFVTQLLLYIAVLAAWIFTLGYLIVMTLIAASDNE